MSSCTREGLDWQLEGASSLKAFSSTGIGSPGTRLNLHSWRCLNNKRCGAKRHCLAPHLTELDNGWVLGSQTSIPTKAVLWLYVSLTRMLPDYCLSINSIKRERGYRRIQWTHFISISCLIFCVQNIQIITPRQPEESKNKPNPTQATKPERSSFDVRQQLLSYIKISSISFLDPDSTDLFECKISLFSL